MAEPFLGSEALAAGTVTQHQLRTRFVAVHQNVYLPAGTELTPVTRAKASWLRTRRRGVLVGFSASALHGAKWVSSNRPAEINDTNHKRTRGVIARGVLLQPDEICQKAGMAVTTPERTALDLLCWYPPGHRHRGGGRAGPRHPHEDCRR